MDVSDPLSPPLLAAEFTATRADMAAFQRFVTGRIRASVRSPVYWLVLVLAAVLVGGVLSGVAGIQIDLRSAVTVALLVVAIWWPLSRLYRVAASPGERGSLVGPRVVTLSGDGVRQRAPLHHGFTAWEGVLGVHETASHVFLMTDTLAGYIVPRRAFASTEQWRTFVELARKRADEAAHGRDRGA